MNAVDISDCKLSVVIPSLGGACLRRTLLALESSTALPDEIIVCIPEDIRFDDKFYAAPNLRFLRTTVRGQVGQRALGFKEASNKLVLQLDDDVEVSPGCILSLLNSIKRLGFGHVVGPVLVDALTRDPLCRFKSGISGICQSLYFWIFGSLPLGRSRMGRLSSICVACCVDPNLSRGGLVSTDWLPGGCVLGFRDELVTDNFFPFDGKAYSEDCLHSVLRQKNGVQHFVDLGATASTTVFPCNFSFRSYVDEMRKRIGIVKLIGGNTVRAYIFVVVEFVKRLVVDRL